MDSTLSALIALTNRLAAKCARFVGRSFFMDQWQVLRNDLLARKAVARNLLPLDLGHLPIALVVCEDKRFFSHYGVDVYSVARALHRAMTRRSTEGASTITQQLVRVYTHDYRYSLARKVKEIALATLADEILTKDEQIRLYLLEAYFGWRMNGLLQITHRLDYPMPFSTRHAAEIVARLKYPEPCTPSNTRCKQIGARVNHILALIDKDRP